MEISREAILSKTHYGLNIYAHVLRQYYQGETVLSLSGRDCKPAKNPFNADKPTLMVKIVDGIATHTDTEEAIAQGNVFDFASLHFSLEGQALLEKINEELYLRIGKERGFIIKRKRNLRLLFLKFKSLHRQYSAISKACF